MKRTIIMAILLLTMSVSFADHPKKKFCSKTQGEISNSQCTYQVKGQMADDKEAISKLYAMSNMPYALCSGTICTVNKDHPDMSTCLCKIYGLDQQGGWFNASVGPHPFKTSMPEAHNNKLVSVVSNFSLANKVDAKNVKSMNCEFEEETAWANCYGVRCNIENNVANCQCPIAKTKDFFSMGPKNEKECKLEKGKIWSGATKRAAKNNFAVIQDMYEHFYPEAPVRD